jgi:hypothetical protein
MLSPTNSQLSAPNTPVSFHENTQREIFDYLVVALHAVPVSKKRNNVFITVYS